MDKKYLVIGLIIFFVFVVLLGIYLFLSYIKAPQVIGGEKDHPIFLEIKKSQGFNEIISNLKEKSLIQSELAFKIYSLLSGQAGKLKPGKYFFNNKVSAQEILKSLVAGPGDILMVIRPGMTLREIDDELSSAGIIKEGSLIALDITKLKNYYDWLGEAISLEGFLLPDTYYFSPDFSEELVVRKFLDNFEVKVLPFLKDNGNIISTLTLASILEKELPNYEDQRIVAGILLKRMEINMPLQVDAAVIYAKCIGRFTDCPRILIKDYRDTDSPYNTYLYKGFPPTPISNPSLSTVKAALSPVKTDYLFYLSDPETKKTIFSKTLDEHNNNRAIYINR